jgi:hypothetical protein
MENWLLMQIFYHRLTTSTLETIDAAAGGVFLLLTVTEPTKLEEHKYKNNHRSDQILVLKLP